MTAQKLLEAAEPTHPAVRLLLLALPFLLLAACGVSSRYPLPATGARAQRYLEPIAACAEEMGHETTVHDDAVHVQPMAEVWLYYRLNVDDELGMVIHHTEGQPSGDIARESKAIGDAIWECAQGRGA